MSARDWVEYGERQKRYLAIERAERAVVKAAMDIYLRGGFCDVNLHRSLERLEAAKAKARRKP